MKVIDFTQAKEENDKVVMQHTHVMEGAFEFIDQSMTLGEVDGDSLTTLVAALAYIIDEDPSMFSRQYAEWKIHQVTARKEFLSALQTSDKTEGVMTSLPITEEIDKADQFLSFLAEFRDQFPKPEIN